MLFNKLTLISIAAIISIASILVFIIPTDSIETQSLINNETQSVINSEKPPMMIIPLSLDQSISVSEANNRVAINLFKLLVGIINTSIDAIDIIAVIEISVNLLNNMSIYRITIYLCF